MTVKISIPASVLMAGSVGRQTIGSLGSSEDSTNASLKKTAFNERHPKVVRSLTVVAYIFCVSLAAILLSMYYVVLWTPADAQKNLSANKTIPTCHAVTHGPDGDIGYVPQYRYSSRFKTSSRISSPGRYGSRRRIIPADSNHLSLQQDSPYRTSNKNNVINNNKITINNTRDDDDDDDNEDEDETNEEKDVSSYEVAIEIPKTKPTTFPASSTPHKSRSFIMERIVYNTGRVKSTTTTTAIPLPLR